MKIEKNKLYIYTGPEPGKGEIHQLIQKVGECVTWGRTRHAFRGSVEEFVANFQPLEEQPA